LFNQGSSLLDITTQVGEQTITYDKQGNPTSYLGHTLTWQKGRQLASYITEVDIIQISVMVLIPLMLVSILISGCVRMLETNKKVDFTADEIRDVMENDQYTPSDFKCNESNPLVHVKQYGFWENYGMEYYEYADQGISRHMNIWGRTQTENDQ